MLNHKILDDSLMIQQQTDLLAEIAKSGSWNSTMLSNDSDFQFDVLDFVVEFGSSKSSIEHSRRRNSFTESEGENEEYLK